MNKELDWTAKQCMPTRAAVLKCQGIPKDVHLDARLESLVQQAETEFSRLAAPRALIAEISRDRFAEVYRGEGCNEPVAPVAEIFPGSEQLVLFVGTVGEAAERKVQYLFEQNDFAAGSMLDSVASAAADRIALLIENKVLNDFGDDSLSALAFSPGYCGWHVSGQRQLFDYLQPETIGVNLRPSYLMEPLKSVSGVVIVGAIGLFEFDDDYDFCAACRDRSCQNRRPTRLLE
jgi:hypothetical protein